MLIFPKKFVGFVCFADEKIEIDRAIYRSKEEVVIEYKEDGYNYNVSLQSDDGRIFKGKYTATKAGKEETGNVSARMYWDEIGPILIGSWSEDGNYTWFARLDETNKFDE